MSCCSSLVNPLMGRATDTAAMQWLVHWPLMGGNNIWYIEEGPGRVAPPPCPLHAVPNVTAHRSTALIGGLLHLVQRGGDRAGAFNGQCIPVTALLYNGPLLCGFNVSIKWLIQFNAVLLISMVGSGTRVWSGWSQFSGSGRVYIF